MNDKYYIPSLIFIAAMAVIALGAGIYNFQNNAVNELSAELSNRLNSHETHIESVQEAIMLQGERIDTERLNNIAMAKIILKLEDQNTQQQIDIAILKARGDVTTQPSNQPTPTSSIDLRLKISDNKGNTKSQGYPRDRDENVYRNFSIRLIPPNFTKF